MDLNRGQTLGLNLDMHIVLDAGAGTGKTACIVQRVLEHYLSEDQRATRLLPPGPREVDFGGGFLQTPAKDRENLRQWRGLLPTEVVVLTFTVKAADEMRDRMRSELARLRAGPRGVRNGLRYDPRIRNEGLIEQLTMLLDEAPIGTIDSFLNRLVSSYRSLLGDRPTHEQMSDAQRALLMERALSSLWRIRSEKHAGDLRIMSVSPADFLAARNRLSHQLGGRSRTQKIVSQLLHNSIFVDTVRRSLESHSGRVDAEAIRASFLSHLRADEIHDFALELFSICDDWLNAAKQRSEELGLPAALLSDTRVNALDTLVDNGIPDDLWDKLLWVYHATLAICSKSSIENIVPSSFPRGLLPNTDGWASGVQKLSSIKDKDVRAAVKEAMEDSQNRSKILFGTIRGMRIRSCAMIANLLDPRLGPPCCPTDSAVHVVRLSDPFPSYIDDEPVSLEAETDARIIADLLIVHKAAEDVLTELRLQEGLHDHSDVTQAAEDLLLARCPRICTRWYPPDITAALNAIDDEQPWRDEHIHAAISLCGNPDDGEIARHHVDYPMKLVKEDLERRYVILKTLRRRFRAFIIDEAQDNSNQQWRLLSRLWGEREEKEGDPEPPNSPWQPTVCWVGDQKQSIYGFRQAQVSGMARYTVHLRAINEHEYASEPRLLLKPALRRRDAARDPRLLEIKNFITGLDYVNHRPIPEEAWVEFDRGDDDRRLDQSDVIRRTQGHVDLVTNYRTCNDLLQTMNEWWVDLFDPRHHLFPGDWYAYAKGLRAHRIEESGQLEWLLPIATGETSNPPSDLTIPLDPFSLGSAAKQVHLEHELVATRIRSLIDGVPASVLSSELESTIVPSSDNIEPRDIMILMPSRTHMQDLIRRLDDLGIPALADQEGGLLEQPIVMALSALLQLTARRFDVSRAATLTRTPLVGFNDIELEKYIADKDGPQDLLERLQDHAISKPQRELFCRWKQLADCNRILKMLEETLDYSDLLLAYPNQVDRQYAEQFLALIRSQMAEAGGDVVLLAERIKRLSSVNGKLLPGEAMPPSNAVRVMTIHASKGLQSKVVVVCGLFSENQSNLGQSLRSNILVSQQMFSPRAKPWKSRDAIDSGSWRLSTEVLTSQVQAEARRLFYVACTRVKDKLILAGAPKNCKINSTLGEIEIPWKYKPTPRFGWMWLEAIRQAARRDGLLEAPWLIGDDSDLPAPLPFRSKGTLTILPNQMMTNPSLAPGLLNSLSIFHHPDYILPSREITSPLVKYTRLQGSARLPIVNDTESLSLRKASRKIRIAPHMLDSANSCIRRHWLKQYVGISSEAINLPLIQQNEGENSEGDFDEPIGPAANVLGSLFHRLVELGIPNPGVENGKASTPLSSQWFTPTPNRMLDQSLIFQVLDELLPATVDRDITAKMLQRMAEIFIEGKLGKLVKGDAIEGLHVEALRTEWPFLINIKKPLSSTYSTRWTPQKQEIVEEIESLTFELDGIADLVLCQTDGKSRNTIRAIDLKTTGAMSILNPPQKTEGTIYEIPSNPDDEIIRTDAEVELLNHYRIQLYLYHLCLVRQERMRAESGIGEREVLRPAILVATTGRLISWTEEEFAVIEEEFNQLIKQLAEVEIELRGDESNFPRMPIENKDICDKCPYFQGNIKLCAPQGIALGMAQQGESEENGFKI
jgi:ATP-dependent exoDNAse (exonuclease V) beta subunit